MTSKAKTFSPEIRTPTRVMMAVGLAALPSSCDPTLNFYGALFPAWLVCLFAGVFGAALLRPLFAWTGVEPHLAPLAVVYPSLATLIGCLLWLWLFR
jgi:hypothetical protein